MDRIVEDDPEFEFSTTDYYGRVFYVEWKRPPESGSFLFKDGAIKTKNPNLPTIRKMVEIARLLDARVLGESDEEYGEDGNPV